MALAQNIWHCVQRTIPNVFCHAYTRIFIDNNATTLFHHTNAIWTSIGTLWIATSFKKKNNFSIMSIYSTVKSFLHFRLHIMIYAEIFEQVAHWATMLIIQSHYTKREKMETSIFQTLKGS